MIATQPIAFSLSSRYAKRRSGLGHLLSAAVVSPQFQQLLLKDPQMALKRGYLGSAFELSTEERERILVTQANSLADLARKLAS